jgi:hypothetical protein
MATEVPRFESLEEFIRVDALTHVFFSLWSDGDENAPLDPFVDRSKITAIDNSLGWGDLVDRLWPGDDAMEEPEHLVAVAAAEARAARMLFALADAAGSFDEDGRRLAGLAEKHLADARKAEAVGNA